MFDLQFISQPSWSTEINEHIIRGRITLAEFSEEFESSLSYWSQTEYERQWLAAARRIKNGETKSAFIVNLHDPRHSTFLVWWLVWSMNGVVFVQNQLLFLDRLSDVFDPANPYRHVEERIIETDEGNVISEWQVNLRDIEDFIEARVSINAQ